MTERLMDLLEYRVVLAALTTTLDGLVIAQAGLSPDDAELLAAASSSQLDTDAYTFDTTRGGMLHVLRGHEMRLILLTDIHAPQHAISDLMHRELGAIEAAITV